MTATPTSIGELFRSLGLTLTVRSAADEDEAWACTLTRPDGKTYEIESVAFFDVDPDTGDEWIVEPSPSPRALGARRRRTSRTTRTARARTAGAADAEAAARDFLGDEAYELLNELDATGEE